MTEPRKLDAGKARFDLVPWGDLNIVDIRIAVEDAYEALRTWHQVKPHQLDSVAFPRVELRGVAEVLGMGAAKYGDRNWEGGIAYSRIFAAAARHAEAHLAGEYVDPESGFAHASHFWCNYLFLATFAARGRTDLDDRPAPNPGLVARLDEGLALRAQIMGVMSPGPNPAKPNGVN